MTPESLNFTGDAVTFLGLLGVASTFLIIITSFRRFFNSPYNIRVISKVTQKTTTETTES